MGLHLPLGSYKLLHVWFLLACPISQQSLFPGLLHSKSLLLNHLQHFTHWRPLTPRPATPSLPCGWNLLFHRTLCPSFILCICWTTEAHPCEFGKEAFCQCLLLYLAGERATFHPSSVSSNGCLLVFFGIFLDCECHQHRDPLGYFLCKAHCELHFFCWKIWIQHSDWLIDWLINWSAASQVSCYVTAQGGS